MKNLKGGLRATVAALGLLTMSACASDGQYAVQGGTPPTTNFQPLTDAFACVGSEIRGSGPVRIAVGDVKDYTGKVSFEAEEGGYKVTQGGALMVMSALGRLAPQIQQVERFDTSVFRQELDFVGKQMVRDPGPGMGVVRVPTAGMIEGADFHILGGITEVNYNIQSGGAEVNIAGIGGGARYFVLNVAADLRLVDARSLRVVKTVSLQKQVAGHEVKANVFRFFFADSLFDINAGSKQQEPIQMAVRAVLNRATLELVTAAYGKSFDACVDAAEQPFSLPKPDRQRPIVSEAPAVIRPDRG